MIRALIGALAGALLLPAALWASGTPDLMATTLAPVGDLKVGGGATLHWTGVSAIASPDAVVAFAVRGPGDDDYATLQTVSKGKVREAQALEEVFAWTPADGPGRYMVAASVKCARPGGNSWAKSDVVLLDVAADGSISVGRHVPPTAEQWARRGRLAANPRLEKGLQFGRGALPDAPPASAASDEKTLNTPFTVKGVVRFTDRPYTDGAFGAPVAVPARRATVWIMEDEPGPGDFSLVQTTTDNFGNFSVVVPDNNDGPGESTRDVYIRVYAQTPAGTVYAGEGGTAYRFETVTKSNWAGGTMDWGTTTIGLPLSGPHHIADTILRGWDYAKARGNAASPLIVYWTENAGDSYYMDADVPVYVSIGGQFVDPDEFDDDVILHEYGHYVADQFSEDKSQGGNHSWFSEISPQLAWSEGWAAFYAGIVRNHRISVDHAAGAAFSSRNRETPGVGKPGLDNEGAICGTLWDIWDSSSDSPDSLSGGIAKIWPIFDGDFDSTKYCTFEDYYAGYKKRAFSDRSKVDLIMAQFGIKLNVAPRVLYPSDGGIVWAHGENRTVKWEGFDTPTVRIRFYKDDASFTGFVTVPNGGSWILKNIPESYQEGNKFDVLIQSSDGLQWDFADEYFEIVSAEEVLKLNDPANASQLSTDYDKDWYRFVVTSAATVTMQTQSGAAPALGDSILELYGPNSRANKLATNDDASPTNTMSKIVKTLSAGTYYLKVTGYGGAVGNYTVRVTKP